MFDKGFIQNIDANLKYLVPSGNYTNSDPSAEPSSTGIRNTAPNDVLLKNSNLDLSLGLNPTVSDVTTPVSSVTSINRHLEDFKQLSEQSINLSNTIIPENDDNIASKSHPKITSSVSADLSSVYPSVLPPNYNHSKSQEHLPSYGDLLSTNSIDHLKYNLFFQSNKELNQRLQANLDESLPEYSSDLYKLGIALIKFEKNSSFLEVLNNTELNSQINYLSKNPWKLVIVELNSTVLNIYKLNIFDQKNFDLNELKNSYSMTQDVQADKESYYSKLENNTLEYDKDFIHFKSCKDIFKVFDTFDSGVIPVSNKEYPQNCSYFYRYHGIPETQNLKEKFGLRKSSLFKNLNKSSSSTDMSLYSFADMSQSSITSFNGGNNSNSNSDIIINDLNSYAILKKILRKPKKFLNSNNLLTSLTLQYGKLGLANDILLAKNEMVQVSKNFGKSFLTYSKNPNNILRFRLENYQFLLNFKYVNDLIFWYNALTFSIDLSLDLSLRELPTFNNIPARRRRRRRRRRKKNNSHRSGHRSLSISGMASSLSSINNSTSNESSRRRSQPDTFRRRLSSGTSSVIRRRAFSTASSTSSINATPNLNGSISTASAKHQNNTAVGSPSSSALKMRTSSPIMSFFLSEFDNSNNNMNNNSELRSRSRRTSSNASFSLPSFLSGAIGSSNSTFSNSSKRQTIQSLRKKKSSGLILNTLSLSLANKDTINSKQELRLPELKKEALLASNDNASCAVSSPVSETSTTHSILSISLENAFTSTADAKKERIFDSTCQNVKHKPSKIITKSLRNRDRAASLNSTFTLDSAKCMLDSTNADVLDSDKCHMDGPALKSEITDKNGVHAANNNERVLGEYLTIFDNNDNSSFQIDINKIINFGNNVCNIKDQENEEKKGNGNDERSFSEIGASDEISSEYHKEHSDELRRKDDDKFGKEKFYDDELAANNEIYEDLDNEIYEDDEDEDEDEYEDEDEDDDDDDQYDDDENDDEDEEGDVDDNSLLPSSNFEVFNSTNPVAALSNSNMNYGDNNNYQASNESKFNDSFFYFSHHIYEKLSDQDANPPTLKKIVKDCLKSMSVMKKDDSWTNMKLVLKELNVSSNKKGLVSSVSSSSSSLPLKSFRGGLKNLKFGSSNNSKSNNSLSELSDKNRKKHASLGYFMIANQNLFHWDYALKTEPKNDENDNTDEGNEIIEMIYAC